MLFARTTSRVLDFFATVGREAPYVADTWAHSRAFVVLARLGIAAQGAVFLVVGFVAVLGSVGVFSHAHGVEEAIVDLAHAPLGSLLVIVLALGFFAYAFWRFVQAAWDPEGPSYFFLRVGRLFPAAIYFVLGIYSFAVPLAGAARSGNDWVRIWIGRLLALPLGGFIVICIGVGFFLTGAIQILWVCLPHHARSLDLKRVSRRVRWVTSIVSRVGIGARGVVFALIGLFLLEAGHTEDPRSAQSIGGALEIIRQQRWGGALLGAVGIGFIAYGLSRFLAARYRPFHIEHRSAR